MAKSFKKLPVPLAEQPKRTSEKDIFDFIEEERTTPPSAAPRGESSVSNISNTRNTKDGSNTTAINVTSVTQSEIESSDIRQTFIIGQHYLERLKDYVHTRRIQGQYDYTQKQALHDALDALFGSTAIEPRPNHIRQQEEARKQKIRRGIPK